MGYLTPVLFYNDSIHDMKEDPTFPERLYLAATSGKEDNDVFVKFWRKTKFDKFLSFFGLYRKPGLKQHRGGGSCAMVLKAQHADTPRVIVAWGNTWIDLTQEFWDKSVYHWSHDSVIKGRTDKSHLDYVKKCMGFAQQDLTRLKKALKDSNL